MVLPRTIEGKLSPGTDTEAPLIDASEEWMPEGFVKGRPNQTDHYGRCIEWDEQKQTVILCKAGSLSHLSGTEEDTLDIQKDVPEETEAEAEVEAEAEAEAEEEAEAEAEPEAEEEAEAD